MSRDLQVPNSVLQDMYATNTVQLADGSRVGLRESVAPENAEGLYRAVLSERPGRVLEVGMANGASSLAILTALDEIGTGGSLTSIDPHQMTDWRGGGVENIRRAGFSTSHRLISEPDYLALPGLLRSGASFDFVYLDGWHNFDYTLLDFFFADLMLSPSGVVGFNDCDWKPVARVLSFVQGHRHYDRIDFCLPARWGDRGKFSRTSRRALHRLNPSLPESRAVGPLLGRRREDQYFRKLDAWEPPHGYWKALRTRPWPSHGKVGPVYRP